MKAKYELVVDYGKPYSEHHKTLASLKDALIKLDKYYDSHSHELPYFEVEIYENDENVTEKIFQKLKLGFYKQWKEDKKSKKSWQRWSGMIG